MSDDGFPAVAYVPGHGVRPQAEPGPAPAPLDPADYTACAPYLHGLALFDRGYYWEAHEILESLWIAAGRVGATAELLRGLIQLAAAGVKVRQGKGEGAVALAARAKGHFSQARASWPTSSIAGLELDALLAFADDVHENGAKLRGSPTAAVEVVFDRRLR